MQRLQFSISWLQTTEVSFTSVFFYPLSPPLFQPALLLIFGKVSRLPPTIRYSRVIYLLIVWWIQLKNLRWQWSNIPNGSLNKLILSRFGKSNHSEWAIFWSHFLIFQFQRIYSLKEALLYINELSLEISVALRIFTLLSFTYIPFERLKNNYYRQIVQIS